MTGKSMSEEKENTNSVDSEIQELLEQGREKVRKLAEKTGNERLIRDYERFIASQIVRFG